MSPEDAFARKCYMAGYYDGSQRMLSEFANGKSMRYLRMLTVPEPNIGYFRNLEEMAQAEVLAEKN